MVICLRILMAAGFAAGGTVSLAASPPDDPAPASVTTSLPATAAPKVDAAKLPAPNPGFSAARVADTTEQAPPGAGAFRTVCTVSHLSFDDPIVFYGQKGRSHLHTFFGNTGADANSTAESLRESGNSTCRGGIVNRSAYWVPTLIDTRDGTPLMPSDIGTYYKNGYLAAEIIRPIPAGLRMIAGNPTASGPSKELAVRFKCIGGPNKENDKYGPTIGNCDVGARLISEVFFPQCWDGLNLDSPDHKSHMSYTVKVPNPAHPGWYMPACPASHPVALPQVAFNVVYKVTEKDAPLHWRLASDAYDPSLPGGYSSHGDWFNGWDSKISDAWAKNCIQAKRDCHGHLLGDGRRLF